MESADGVDDLWGVLGVHGRGSRFRGNVDRLPLDLIKHWAHVGVGGCCARYGLVVDGVGAGALGVSCSAAAMRNLPRGDKDGHMQNTTRSEDAVTTRQDGCWT